MRVGCSTGRWYSYKRIVQDPFYYYTKNVTPHSRLTLDRSNTHNPVLSPPVSDASAPRSKNDRGAVSMYLKSVCYWRGDKAQC
jgi:hypothetical protein